MVLCAEHRGASVTLIYLTLSLCCAGPWASDAADDSGLPWCGRRRRDFSDWRPDGGQPLDHHRGSGNCCLPAKWVHYVSRKKTKTVNSESCLQQLLLVSRRFWNNVCFMEMLIGPVNTAVYVHFPWRTSVIIISYCFFFSYIIVFLLLSINIYSFHFIVLVFCFYNHIISKMFIKYYIIYYFIVLYIIDAVGTTPSGKLIDKHNNCYVSMSVNEEVDLHSHLRR